jgi:arginase
MPGRGQDWDVHVIAVPYHLDEYAPDLDLPLAAPRAVVVASLPAGDVWGRLAALYGRVADEVAAAVEVGSCPLVVAGDCTTSLGVMAGLQRGGVDAAVVWFDAHGDVQTVETTTSGYVGGMPLRLLVGYRPKLISDALGLRAVPEDRVMLVGARDLDPPEVEFLASSPIIRSDVADFEVDDAPGGALYVHLDVDIFDPSYLSGLRFPAPYGPTSDDVVEAVRALLNTGRVAALGVACTWYPGYEAGQRANAALQQILADDLS